MVKVKSEGIHCNGCVDRIDKVLTAEGIAHTITLDTKIVEADCSLEELTELLDDMGFPVEEV